ncbi:MAG: PIG-L family deacetylase [Verrucomicrobia bacterium]|nr:PIG-L family deacetylase [Verrucomicrobiota bacterium]
MNQARSTRRSFLWNTLAAAGPALSAVTVSPAAGAGVEAPRNSLRVVCVGGHPDDPESGAAGTLALYAQQGHSVTVIYLTRGERGISGKSNDEAAAIRTAECEAACKIIGAKPVFAGQIDGSTESNRVRVEEMQKILAAEAPDILITHWPVDTHLDHQVASLLAFRVYLALKPRPHLYYFEVNTGSQSLGFTPNVYVDITSVREKKKAALAAHRSQDGEGIGRTHHEIIANYRGREAGVAAAEAFFHLNRDVQTASLPGL